ncbi:GntR family transcriptional regulator [Streptomyces sp. NPDC092296]|uniref:GntR family transcriptional regulator n=1 Tax=Streptomyces sp. NPDC092296 TaxID=3366012 RepID=UPI003828AD7D
MAADTSPLRLPDDGLSRVPLGDQIRRVLLEQLLNGRWKPGDRIVERRVAADLGVSQAPVREALRDLQAMQLVETSPNRGVRVRQLTPERITETYPVRAALERLAAELALPRLAQDTSALERHVARMSEAAATQDVDGQIRHAVAFHEEIVRAAGNQVLLRSWEALGIELWTRLSLRWLRTELHENAADHEPIIAAFRQGDPAAGLLLEQHVLGYAHRSGERP